MDLRKSLIHLKIIILTLIILGTPVLISAYSPRLYFNSDELIELGAEFQVDLLVQTDQPVNAYSINFVYPANNLELIRIDNSKSIADVWRDSPRVFEGGRINFNGGGLEPFSGDGGLILSIIFKAIQLGEVRFNFEDSSLYLANGKGTKVEPSLDDLTIKIREGNGEILAQNVDNNPPEVDFISIIEDPITPDQRILSFKVKDEESGIKETLIRTKHWLWWDDFEEVPNSLALSKGAWAINFRVVDNQGNISEKFIYDWKVFLKRILPILIVIIGALFLVINRIRKPRKVIINSND